MLSSKGNVTAACFALDEGTVAGKRVLVAEDYQQLCDLIGVVLSEVGHYTVATATDGGTAEQLILERTFDLVILDIGLPGILGGREIATVARGRVGCPIPFITGRDLAESYCADLMQPVVRFLRKPFKMDFLLGAVGAMLKVGAPKQVRLAKRVRAQKIVAHNLHSIGRA